MLSPRFIQQWFIQILLMLIVLLLSVSLTTANDQTLHMELSVKELTLRHKTLQPLTLYQPYLIFGQVERSLHHGYQQTKVIVSTEETHSIPQFLTHFFLVIEGDMPEMSVEMRLAQSSITSTEAIEFERVYNPNLLHDFFQHVKAKVDDFKQQAEGPVSVYDSTVRFYERDPPVLYIKTTMTGYGRLAVITGQETSPAEASDITPYRR